jgi:hypothetical protein
MKNSFRGKHVLSDLICNTSPFQYLYQLELLNILQSLAGRVIVPPAVVDELTEGRALGLNLPDLSSLSWITLRRPVSEPAVPLVTDLEPGETEVLMLAFELPEAVVVLDDAFARNVAETLGFHLKGTLGLLLDAKRLGLIPAVRPLIDQLHALRFRVSPNTRAVVLKLAGE